MNTEKLERSDAQYYQDDRIATQKDLKIMALELRMDLELKIASIESSLLKKLGGLIIACSGILFGLLSYFHR